MDVRSISTTVPSPAPRAGGYVMEPEVAEQVARLARLPRTRLVPAVVEASAGDAPIGEETLVHFVRRCRRDGDDTGASELLRLLTKRVSGRLARQMRIWRLAHPPDLAEDVVDEVLTDLYDQLLSDDPAAGFWEIRFWVCFNRRALNVLKRRRRELDQIVADEGDDWDDEREPRPVDIDRHAVHLDQPETHAVIDDALVRLPQPLRTAFLLKHWSGYPEEPGVDGAPSIASMMGVSGRTVRNYLARAAKHLAEWRSEDEANG
ncbi:MAG: RNA polymerase sigma factor [Capsulimonadaceae bacterium]|nr:RNA polymerase sigma factor [Capsulimonadaceae bacterium]